MVIHGYPLQCSVEDLSENLQYLEKRFQCDNAVYKNQCRNRQAFRRYASYHWVFLNGSPMGDPCNALSQTNQSLNQTNYDYLHKNQSAGLQKCTWQ